MKKILIKILLVIILSIIAEMLTSIFWDNYRVVIFILVTAGYLDCVIFNYEKIYYYEKNFNNNKEERYG